MNFKRRTAALVALCLTLFLALSANSTASFQSTITVISWNVESGDSNPTAIAQQIKNINGCDIWGFSEVDASTMPGPFEAAAEDGENADFQRILGTTGAGDRLMIVYDADRFEKLGQEELQNINVSGTVRASLVGRFRDRQSTKEFLFMVNHLYRGSEAGRHEQAKLLNQWAKTQTLPVINVGDFNFDWAVDNGDTVHDGGYDFLTQDGVFKWVRPAMLKGTQCSEGVANPRSVLDFVFVSGIARLWPATSEILTTANDCPDSGNQTSDHRMLKAVFTLTGAPPDNTNLKQQILGKIQTIEEELAKLKTLANQLP
jgi:endonuclease/exonuclease/phosphatase family metal-dependent hydrolase